MSDKNLKLMEAITEIARAAGGVILDVYRNGKFETKIKGDKSPLTVADELSHALIVERLAKISDYPVISEESEHPSYLIRKEWKRFWLIDPLDGTKEFLNGNDEFTVNIALVVNGIPTLGVVYAPAKNWLYYGGKAFGAFKNGEKIKVRQVQDSQISIVGSKSHQSEEFECFVKKLSAKYSKVDLVLMGSSLKICLVAAGKADIYPRLGLTSEWDTAAAHAVLLGAGGDIRTVENAVLKYNAKESLLNPFFYVLGDKEINEFLFKRTNSEK